MQVSAISHCSSMINNGVPKLLGSVLASVSTAPAFFLTTPTTTISTMIAVFVFVFLARSMASASVAIVFVVFVVFLLYLHAMVGKKVRCDVV